MHNEHLDLDDLDMNVVEVDAKSAPQLEMLAGGHLMTEVGASAVGQSTLICSCCCCCC